MAELRELKCPKCKTLRYTTSQEMEYRCVACGVKLRLKISAPIKKPEKGQLANALGVEL